MKYSRLMLLLIVYTLVQINFIVCNQIEPNYYHYLQQFGYTPKVEGRRLFSSLQKSSYNEAVLKFQRLFKLPETGELDETTKSFMKKARCGNPDLGTVSSMKQPLSIDVKKQTRLSRSKSKTTNGPQSYVTHTVTWPKKDLKWFIVEYPKHQSKFQSQEKVVRVMKQAFDDWEKNSGLAFKMASTAKDADLKIRFNTKDHGDGYPFDGPGATLAHAFYPTTGDIHFDDDEQFVEEYVDHSEKYNLRLVAAHEIGHALGLSHSFEEDSLMFPVYQLFPSNFSLPVDDQKGIQTLYGKPDEKPSVPTTSTKSPFITKNPGRPTNRLPKNHWCNDNFQTGCEGPDNSLYLFKDDEVWRYNPRGQRFWDSRPTQISKRFPVFTDRTITACVKSSSGHTYFFRNYRMWKLKTHWFGEGPQMINGKNYPQNPTAALLHKNSIYLLRNNVFYEWNEHDTNQELEIISIDKILKRPPNEYIYAGFTYKKHHYIFTEYDVYVYDSSTGDILPGYPKEKGNGWFACEEASSLTQRPSKSSYQRHNEETVSRGGHHGHQNRHRHRGHHHEDRDEYRHRKPNHWRYHH